MSRDATDRSQLKAGDPHYLSYVGPPEQYDFMGATQFRLLCTLGLRSGHRLLDFGCGSLRAGRFLMMYLDPGNYYGVEPNKWLLEDALAYEVGQDLIEIKRPVFDHNDRFELEHLKIDFDFIIAQSIFSHTGRAITAKCLQQFAAVLKPTGRILVTFVEGEYDPVPWETWVYPHCCTYLTSTIRELIDDSGLLGARLPWYHPRQTWYLLAREASALPTPAMLRHLSGAVLFDPEFEESWRPKPFRIDQAAMIRKPLSALKSLLRGRKAA